MKTVTLTEDDIAWISNKLNQHYAVIKTTDVLSEEEKNVEIGILVQRALNFGLKDLVSRFGYVIFEVPLGKDRSAQLVLPKDYTKADIEIIESRITLHTQLLIENKNGTE